MLAGQRQSGEQNVSRLLGAATRPEGERIVSHFISRALVFSNTGSEKPSTAPELLSSGCSQSCDL